MNAKHRHRRRDRSTSEERSRTRTYRDPEDSYVTDYSDDFEPDTKSATPPYRRKEKENNRRGNRNAYYSDQSSTSQLHSSATSKKSTQSVGRRHVHRSSRRDGGTVKHGWRSRSYSKDSRSHRSQHASIAARMLSAKQRKIEEIQNELYETEERVRKIQKENRLLRTMQHRQDKALRQFQDTESDLPRLIAQNFEDQRVLKARLKKTKEAEKALEDKLRENNDEMQKMEGTLRRLKKIVYDKNLGERSELSRQLTNTENNLTVAERKIKELEKKLELTISSFTRQINSERMKHKETKQNMEMLHEDYKTTKEKLKEKERALDVSNIYSLRKKDSPEKSFMTVSSSSTPRTIKVNLKSSSTQTDMAVMALSKTDTLRSAVHTTSPNLKQIENSDVVSDYPHSERSPKDLRKKDIELPDKSNSHSPLNGLHAVALKSHHVEKTKENEPAVFLTSKPDSPISSPNMTFELDSKRLAKTKPAVKQEQLETLLLKSEAQEDTDTAKKEEEERKKAEEKVRYERVQKDKALLLAKLREVEDGPEDESPLNFRENSLGSKTKSKPERKKSALANETDPVVENLHLGRPSITTGAKKKPEKELSFGSYAPSVGTSSVNRKGQAGRSHLGSDGSGEEKEEALFDLESGKQNKKSDLLSQLFGPQEKTNKGTTDTDLSLIPKKNGEKRENDTGKVTPRAKPVHSGYPWEKNVMTSSNSQSNGPIRKKSLISVSSFHEDEIEELSL